MKFYNCKVKQGGSNDFVMHVSHISAAEGVLLRHLNGSESLVDIEEVEPEEVDERKRGLSPTLERRRLRLKYVDDHAINTLFPGVEPKLPETLPLIDEATEEMMERMGTHMSEDDAVLVDL